MSFFLSAVAFMKRAADDISGGEAGDGGDDLEHHKRHHSADDSIGSNAVRCNNNLQLCYYAPACRVSSFSSVAV